MKHQILLLGKTKDSFLTEGMREYLKRLKRYAAVELKVIKQKNLQGTDVQVKEKEGRLLMESVENNSHLVCLDSSGRMFSSEQFADNISQWERRNIRHVSYVIGGPLGLSQEILGKADECFSLSRMTFTHDMVRLFLLEQIYRAYTIKAGEQYHK